MGNEEEGKEEATHGRGESTAGTQLKGRAKVQVAEWRKKLCPEGVCGR